MPYNEFKRLLGKAGISAKELSELLKQNPNSYTNYKSKGQVPNHLAVIVTLIAEMADNQLDFRSVIKNLCLIPSKPRGLNSSPKFYI